MKSFAAQVSDAVSKYEKRMTATFKASVQDLAEEVTKPVSKGGRMRVDTGFLRSSLMASTSTMPLINASAPPDAGKSYNLDEGAIEAVIIGSQIGDVINLGFTAAYARPREFHDGFVEGAALQWDAIVQRNARKAIRAYP